MIALDKARHHLESLGLSEAAEALENCLDAAAQKKLSYPEVLADLLDIEVSARHQRAVTIKTKTAHLPFKRTLEEFDFSFQPSIDERLVKELASMAFVAEARNLLLLGPPGVGKTHLAVALALKGIEAGYDAYFIKAYDLMEDLKKARAEDRFKARKRIYLRPRLLIIDEFGMWSYDRQAATALFALISDRHLRSSIIFTSNKAIREWGEILDDPVLAAAILDRVLDQCHVINIRGDSYRLRNKQQAGMQRSSLSTYQLLRSGKEES